MRRKHPMRKRRTQPAGPASGVFLYLKLILNLIDYKNFLISFLFSTYFFEYPQRLIAIERRKITTAAIQIQSK